MSDVESVAYTEFEITVQTAAYSNTRVYYDIWYGGPGAPYRVHHTSLFMQEPVLLYNQNT